MNIHIEDRDKFELLKKATLFKVTIGSHMYGTANESSDQDILHIYAVSRMEQSSFVKTHHQYQFKEDGIDYIFVNIDAFLRNTLNGDSTINFEVIHSDEMKNDDIFRKLYHIGYSFCNYNIARSYLGLAKRDLKHMNNSKDDKSRNKKLAHAYRGLQFAEMIMEKDFNPVLSGKKLETVQHLLALNDNETRKSFFNTLNSSVGFVRLDLNEKFDKKTLGLPKYMKPEAQLMLDGFLIGLKDSQFYKERVQDDLLFYSVYEANEEDIKY